MAKLTADARLWFKKWSTWLSALSVAQTAAATAFGVAPPEWRAAFPPQLGYYLLLGSMATAALIPLATSISQKSIDGPKL